MRAILPLLFAWLSLGLCGCLHTIHVTPEPGTVEGDPIPLSLKVDVTGFALEGADHMPGIGLLEWTWRDFRQGVITYIEKRRSFRSVGTDRADLTLSIKAALTMRSRDRYLYILRLEAALSSAKNTVIASYAVETQAAGSFARWTTASDRDPINRALQKALDELLTKIEADRPLVLAANQF
ncbi:MAG: hypothetical protein AB1555_12175 [Nitrospirota bacterium]